MTNMILATTVIMILLTIMMMLMVSLSKKSLTYMQKLTPFECGFNPVSYTRIPFSIHFFMIALIFLIFDIEIIIIMPMILTFKSSIYKYWLTTTILFTIILLMGLYHEWNNGMIKWVS